MLISEFTKSFSNIPRETAASVLEEKKSFTTSTVAKHSYSSAGRVWMQCKLPLVLNIF